VNESFLEGEMFQAKIVRVQKIKTHILCTKTFFSEKKRSVYEIKWKNMALPEGPNTTV
jgi:hypothetical protein